MRRDDIEELLYLGVAGGVALFAPWPLARAVAVGVLCVSVWQRHRSGRVIADKVEDVVPMVERLVADYRTLGKFNRVTFDITSDAILKLACYDTDAASLLAQRLTDASAVAEEHTHA